MLWAEKPKKNVIVSFDGNTWVPAGSATGVTAVSLSIVRERDDKDASPENVRESQLSDICPFGEGALPSKDLPKSEILKRRVFKKTSKDKVMLLKFLVWKTNKESDPRWPAYVFHFTDFSSGRKDPLKRDIRISDSELQIMSDIRCVHRRQRQKRLERGLIDIFITRYLYNF